MVRPLNSVFWRSWQTAILAALFLSAAAGPARGQLAITEIMDNPGGDADALWEWVEAPQYLAGPLDLDGWIFQTTMTMPIAANISRPAKNTIVPAGGVAVLYPGNVAQLHAPAISRCLGRRHHVDPGQQLRQRSGERRRRDRSWHNLADYLVDALTGDDEPTANVRARGGVCELRPSSGLSRGHGGAFDRLERRRHCGDRRQLGLQANGALGAHVSVQTTLSGAAINDVADRGTPGAVPAGGAAAGLLISEVMYDPASQEPAWEWVEVFNNTGAAINFAATPYVFDDDDDASLSAANVKSGAIAEGTTAVLFNASPTNGNTLTNLAAAWGGGVNFIPVITWTDLTNTGDTIALWNSLSAYQGETQSTTAPRRTTKNAAAVVAFDNDTMLGWPVQ